MLNQITPMRPLRTKYRDVNNNKIQFDGKTIANVEINGETKKARTTDNYGKNESITWTRLVETTGDKARNRED